MEGHLYYCYIKNILISFFIKILKIDIKSINTDREEIERIILIFINFSLLFVWAILSYNQNICLKIKY